jgi:hypothetical protein
MNDDKVESTAAPAVLRQEGPHRVTVSAGSNSALSSSVGVGTKRLRPAIGAAPPPGLDAQALSALLPPTLGRRSGRESSRTEVRREAGRKPVDGRFAPGQADPVSSARDQSAAELEARLAALAQFNQHTSKAVTALEVQMSESQPEQPPQGTPPRRGLFKRSSS